MEDDGSIEEPHPTDRYVGLRIKLRRRELGLSQERLAEAIGITFQQVQKYERAANRVSASKLWEIAKALQAPVSYFFAGLPGLTEEEDEPPLAPVREAFLRSNEGLELARAFPSLHPTCRRSLLQLLRAIIDTERALPR